MSVDAGLRIARTMGRERIWCTYGLITSTRASLHIHAAVAKV
jgi:hypothetical protein